MLLESCTCFAIAQAPHIVIFAVAELYDIVTRAMRASSIQHLMSCDTLSNSIHSRFNLDFPVHRLASNLGVELGIMQDPSIKSMAEQISSDPAFAQMTAALQSSMGGAAGGEPSLLSLVNLLAYSPPEEFVVSAVPRRF